MNKSINYSELKKEIFFNEKLKRLSNQYNLTMDWIKSDDTTSKFNHLQLSLNGLKNQLKGISCDMGIEFNSPHYFLTDWNSNLNECINNIETQNRLKSIENHWNSLQSVITKDNLSEIEFQKLKNEIKNLYENLINLSLFLKLTSLECSETTLKLNSSRYAKNIA